MHKLDRKHSSDLAAAIHWLKFRKNILAQTNFFAKNNPMQPTVGALHATREQKSEINQAEARLREIWKRLGFPAVPSTRCLSLKAGLTTTYEYVYHMSSNFVHFNPGQLLRQGWGPIKASSISLLRISPTITQPSAGILVPFFSWDIVIPALTD